MSVGSCTWFMLHVGSATSAHHSYFLRLMVCKCTNLFCTNHCSSQSFISTVGMCNGRFHTYKTTYGELWPCHSRLTTKKYMCYSQLTNLFYISCIWLYGWMEGCAGGWVDPRTHTHTQWTAPWWFIHYSLSYDRSIAASKVSSPQSAIWCCIYQFPASSHFLTIIQ